MCTHPSYNDINPPSVFFFKSPFSNQAALRLLSEWCSSAQAPPTIVDSQDRLTLDPPWVNWELSAIESTLVQGKTRTSPIKWLRCFVVGCNNGYSSRHLLCRHLSSWSGLCLFLKRMWPLIYLNASMFAWIIRDPASPTEEVTIRVFNESLQITFPNNVLISNVSQWMWRKSKPFLRERLSSEERGGVSRAH